MSFTTPSSFYTMHDLGSEISGNISEQCDGVKKPWISPVFIYFFLRWTCHFTSKLKRLRLFKLRPRLHGSGQILFLDRLFTWIRANSLAGTIPVLSHPWIFRTPFRSVCTQPSGRFVSNKLWHKMIKTKINIYFINLTSLS